MYSNPYILVRKSMCLFVRVAAFYSYSLLKYSFNFVCLMKMRAFWNTVPCGLIEVDLTFQRCLLPPSSSG
jgi:hypothetical protein